MKNITIRFLLIILSLLVLGIVYNGCGEEDTVNVAMTGGGTGSGASGEASGGTGGGAGGSTGGGASGGAGGSTGGGASGGTGGGASGGTGGGAGGSTGGGASGGAGGSTGGGAGGSTGGGASGGAGGSTGGGASGGTGGGASGGTGGGASGGTGGGASGSTGGGAGENTPKLLTIVYVDANVDTSADTNDGTSWAKAFKTLQAGIDAAEKVAKTSNRYIRVHVAVGTYKPNDADPSNTSRTQHFALKNNVGVYGGYPQGSSSIATPNPRLTILSGDIGTEGDNDDNVYNVFYHPNSANLDNTAELKNVTITKGNANVQSNRGNGGGMYNENSSPTLTSVNFTDNQASYSGGGMYNKDSNPTLTGGGFTGNRVNYGNGGGMYNVSSSPTLTRVTFTDNYAKREGGGIYNSREGGSTNNSEPDLTNSCTFNDNTADIAGGAMYSDYYSNPRNISPLEEATGDTDDEKKENSKLNGYYKHKVSPTDGPPPPPREDY